MVRNYHGEYARDAALLGRHHHRFHAGRDCRDSDHRYDDGHDVRGGEDRAKRNGLPLSACAQYRHRAGSGGWPGQITATSTSAKGHVTNFSSLHQLNRPALLLSNGVVYIGFGSNGCNDNNTGWILAYEESNLKQVGSFNTSPDIGFTSIWQTGNGLAADEFGNIYA